MDASYKLLVIPKANPTNLYYRVHTEDPKRSIFVCSLTKAIKDKRIKRWFAVNGDVKKVDSGKIKKSRKARSSSDGKNIYFSVVTYRKKSGLKRALDDAAFNAKIAELYVKKV